jgi:hypothetical protein
MQTRCVWPAQLIRPVRRSMRYSRTKTPAGISGTAVTSSREWVPLLGKVYVS